MTEPRRSTRARAREEAAPAAPETPRDTPAKGAKASLKRKRASIAVKDQPTTPGTPIHPDDAAAAGPPPAQGPRQTLPLRIVDGQPLPTLAEPQPLDLPAAEWQNIQQSGVLSASLQRSRAVWVSGVNFRTFHKKHTMPKKMTERTDADKQARARQKDIEKNFPQVGALDAQLVIEPHTFPIKLYAPREGTRAAPKKMAPPQHYGAWPNHSQQPQNRPHSQHPPPYNQYPQPPYGPKQHQQHQHPHPHPRPPPPKPVQQAPAQSAPGPASTPAPDPVIHMLAARAGTDPELKAVMKIVAAGQASKEQLEFFQTHINELTEILDKQKKTKPPLPLPPVPAPPASTPHKQAPAPAPAPPPPPTPAAAPPRPTPPAPQHQQPQQQQQPQHQQQRPPSSTPTPKPFSPAPPPPLQHQHAPPPQPRPPPPHTYPPKPYNQPPHYQHPPPHYVAPPPPRVTYRPLTFEFVEGNGDRFYFPSYSFMEWLPNGSGAKFSFLVTKLKPKPEAPVKPSPTPAPPQTPVPATPQSATAAAPDLTPSATPNTNPPNPSLPPTPTPSYVAPPRIEDFDERNDLKDVDFYQPVTVLVLTDEHDVKSALPRAIRPPSVVEKYMEDVFDTCKRAEETYLAFRLPREGADTDLGLRSGDATPSVATPMANVAMGFGTDRKKSTTGRSRKSLV